MVQLMVAHFTLFLLFHNVIWILRLVFGLTSPIAEFGYQEKPNSSRMAKQTSSSSLPAPHPHPHHQCAEGSILWVITKNTMFILKQVFLFSLQPCVFVFMSILFPESGNWTTITIIGQDSRDPIPSLSLAGPSVGAGGAGFLPMIFPGAVTP